MDKRIVNEIVVCRGYNSATIVNKDGIKMVIHDKNLLTKSDDELKKLFLSTNVKV